MARKSAQNVSSADAASDRALARLRDPASPYARELAALIVAQTLATPISEVAAPRWMASQVAAGLEALTRSEGPRKLAETALEEARARWASEERPLRAWVPPEVDAPLRRVLARPWSPSPELTMRVIDQGIFHDLLRAIIETSLRRFLERVRRFDKDRLGGLGSQARKLGRGLFGGVAQNLTGAAESIVGAVTEEFEGAFEKRIDDFLEGATVEAMREVAGHLTDPSHAQSYAQLRVAVLDVILDAPARELAGEVEKLEPMAVVDIALASLRAFTEQPDLVERLEAPIRELLDRAGDGTLGAWLDQVALREVWVSATTTLLEERLRAVSQTSDFEAWWARLHAE